MSDAEMGAASPGAGPPGGASPGAVAADTADTRSPLRRRLGAWRRRLLEPERAAVARDAAGIAADLAALRCAIAAELGDAAGAAVAAADTVAARAALPYAAAGWVDAPEPVRAAAGATTPVLEIPVGDADAAARLGETPSESCGVVAAIGLIERLPAADVVDLLRHAVRVMRPDGVVLIESANPTVLGTFTGDLYADPAVRRPYHPSLVRFLLAEAGCTSVEFEWLHPAGDALAETTADAQRLSELLFGPTRYLAVGRR